MYLFSYNGTKFCQGSSAGGGGASLPINARALASDGSGNGVDMFKPTTTSTTLSVTGGYIRFNTTTYTTLNVTATLANCTVSSGSSTVTSYLYLTNSGALVLAVPNSLNYSGQGTITNMTVSSVASPGFPSSLGILAYPIATIPLTSNGSTISFGTVTDLRASLGIDSIIAGSGLSCANTSGLLTCSIDTGTVPTLANAVWSGLDDARAASQTFPSAQGTTDPATCTIGQSFFNTTSFTRKDCTALNTWTTGGAGGGTGNAANEVSVSFSATPTFTCGSSSAGTATHFTVGALTGNITSSTLSTCTAGQVIGFHFVQDGTGGRTVAMPSGWDTLPVSAAASTATDAEYWYDGTNGRLTSVNGKDTSVSPAITGPASGGSTWAATYNTCNASLTTASSVLTHNLCDIQRQVLTTMAVQSARRSAY